MLQEFANQINKTVQKAIGGVHTAMPGKIVAFDMETCLATVQPMEKFKKPDGSSIDFPQISGVPIVFPQSTNAAIAWGIQPGDGCLLIFAESALDYWMYGKETDTVLKFDLSNAIAIPGLSASGNPVMQKACRENAVFIQCGKTELAIKQDGISISGGFVINGDVTINGSLTTQGGTVNLN